MALLEQFCSVSFSVYGFYGNRLNIDLDSLSFFSNRQLFHNERASDFIINPVLYHNSATVRHMHSHPMQYKPQGL